MTVVGALACWPTPWPASEAAATHHIQKSRTKAVVQSPRLPGGLRELVRDVRLVQTRDGAALIAAPSPRSPPLFPVSSSVLCP
jgi:hypothetical protein